MFIFELYFYDFVQKKELLQLQNGQKSGKVQETEKPTPPPRRKKEKLPKKKTLSWFISCLQSEENVKCDDVSLKVSKLVISLLFGL